MILLKFADWGRVFGPFWQVTCMHFLPRWRQCMKSPPPPSQCGECRHIVDGTGCWPPFEDVSLFPPTDELIAFLGMFTFHNEQFVSGTQTSKNAAAYFF